jgi:hypothetical protein
MFGVAAAKARGHKFGIQPGQRVKADTILLLLKYVETLHVTSLQGFHASQFA